VTDWTKTQYGYEIPAIPKWIEPFESLNHPLAKVYPFHMITPHPRWRTHSIFHNIPWLRETYQQEITLNASDAKRLGIRTGDTVEAWNGRGRIVLPAYVTERCMPGVVVVFEGAWMDRDRNGVDRAGNPDFLTLDEPSPAGAFAYNTILCNVQEDRTGAQTGLGCSGHRALARVSPRLLTWRRNSTRQKSRRPSKRKVAQTISR
jgi:anaerobic dimethyl sulfoxide reductase subunit A